MEKVERILRETCPEYQASISREQKARQRAEDLKKSLSSLGGESSCSRGVKGAAMTGGGIVLFLLMQIYCLLPIAGALAVIAGIVGFFTGSPYALRAFIAGLAMLAVKPIVGVIFLKIISRGNK